MIGKSITTIAIPELAGAIEFGAAPEVIKKIIADAFTGVALSNFDVLILGCTHYPLAAQAFQEIVPASLALFDPALAVAQRVEKQFWPQEAGNGETMFLISKDSPHFRTLLEDLFPESKYTLEVLE